MYVCVTCCFGLDVCRTENRLHEYPSIQITKGGCGKTKGCFSEPTNCNSSSDCNYLMTYKSDGDDVTFELSSKTAWATVGFNEKDKMVSFTMKQNQLNSTHCDLAQNLTSYC